MNRSLRCGAIMALACWLAGCSTLQGDFHQKLQIDALDAQDRPVEGLPCRVSSGDSASNIVTPARDVRVRRSMKPLVVECRRDNQIATATVKSQREGLEQALLPFGVGSAGVFIDHLSGSLYGYPTVLHLRLGQHLVLEHGGAKVASSEPIAPPKDAKAAAAQRVELAAIQPAPIASQKPLAPVAAKTERAVAKRVKTTSAAPVTPKPLAPATAAVAPVRNAPANW
ncbi:MAG TPA: hypothetical protein VMQ45_05685 [Burkholderiaceae bacterium]|nr:hypothetical protein [Burkholderiaceae bacterium]